MSSNPYDSADAVAELSALYELSFLRYSGSLSGFAGEALEKALRLFGIRRFALWVGPPDARSVYLLSGLSDEQSALSLARVDDSNRFVEALGTDGTLGLLLMEQASAIAPKERRFYNIYARRVEDGLLAAKGEQKRQETFRELALSEERYRMLFEHSMDAIFLGTPGGTIIDVNRAWLDLFGYEREDLASFNAIDFYANPADREHFVRRMAETGFVQDEVLHRRKDGTVFDCQRSVVAQRDEYGNIRAFQGVMRDITEDKRRRGALADELTRRRILLEQSRDGIVVLHQDGSVAEANLSFAQMVGYSPEEVHQLHVWDWDDSFPPDTLVEMLRTVDESGDHFETRHRRKDGSVYDVEISTNGAVFAGQKLIFCVCRDITEQKRARQALKDSEEKFRSLFEQSMDAISLASPDGRVLEANQAYLDLFGYSKEETGNINVGSQYVDPERRSRFLEWMASHDALVDDEVQLKKKDGTIMDCMRTVVLRRNEDGGIIGYQNVIRDVTRQKQAQAELERSHGELRELTARLEAAREEERAEVAWELHDHTAQALSVLKADMVSCRRQLPEEVLASIAPKMNEMTQVLDETIGRLRSLYAELIPVMLEDLGLAATIEWQAEEFARRSGVECKVRRDENLTLPRGRVALGMFRVLQEALDNVRRHSGATRVTVDVTREGGQAVLCVADNGRGFSMRAMRKSGAMGLTGIRERARSWGGSMTVDSSVGVGTVLKVTAPLEGEPAVGTTPESPDI